MRHELYLDIESDGGRITVLGLLKDDEVFQWVGPEIDVSDFRRKLPRSGLLYTMNGKGFDIPWVEKAARISLTKRFDCIDLLAPCRRAGWKGGQKAFERHAGFVRYEDVKGLHGRHAVLLWRRWLRGDRNALKLLLRYNRVDLYGMRAIRRYFAERQSFL